jgi:hypothetical protein
VAQIPGHWVFDFNSWFMNTKIIHLHIRGNDWPRKARIFGSVVCDENIWEIADIFESNCGLEYLHRSPASRKRRPVYLDFDSTIEQVG